MVPQIVTTVLWSHGTPDCYYCTLVLWYPRLLLLYSGLMVHQIVTTVLWSYGTPDCYYCTLVSWYPRLLLLYSGLIVPQIVTTVLWSHGTPDCYYCTLVSWYPRLLLLYSGLMVPQIAVLLSYKDCHGDDLKQLNTVYTSVLTSNWSPRSTSIVTSLRKADTHILLL